MKNFVKYAIVGIAGYFIGFYEMKYKILKILWETKVEKEEKDNDES